MCELFAAAALRRMDCGDYLREFFSHGTEHPHGWGLALFENGEPVIKKEPVSAPQSAYLKKLLLSPVESDLLLAHIRLATKGSIEYRNTHPFVLRDYSERTWTLIHNGTIFDSKELEGYVSRQFGTTDSERILRYLVDRVNEQAEKAGRELTAEERINTAERVIYTITPENKVNLIISDGDLLYVHTNYKDSLHIKEDGGGVIFSTKPLDSGKWRELPLNTLLVYRKNSLVYRGKPHENEFFDSEEKMRFLFLDFAGI